MTQLSGSNIFAKHTEAVELFLGDLYATMVDPLAVEIGRKLR